MSPEQAQGKILDARSDIYSLAVILYEALTTKLPFRAQTPMDYLQKHVLEKPIPLGARVQNLSFPVGLDAVIQRALAKRREDRYQSAMAFAEALRPFSGMYDSRAPSRPPSVSGFGAPAGTPLQGRLLQFRLLQFAFVAAVFLLVGVALTAVALRFVGR
jgi:serine/threonine protein kinase